MSRSDFRHRPDRDVRRLVEEADLRRVRPVPRNTAQEPDALGLGRERPVRGGLLDDGLADLAERGPAARASIARSRGEQARPGPEERPELPPPAPRAGPAEDPGLGVE